MFANHFGLSSLIAIIDHNRMQSLDWCEKTMKMESLADKWRAFGWNAMEIDGHDHDALRHALLDTERSMSPSVIIADTVKGRGISFMENDILWHYRFPHDGWEYDNAVNELYAQKPSGIEDPYTPGGIASPQLPPSGEGIAGDHTMCATWHPSFMEG